MNSTTTTAAFRILVARAIMGDAVDLLPATLKLGTGHYDPVTGALATPSAFATDLADAVVTGVPVTATRNGQVVVLTATAEGDATPIDITEAGVFLTDGTMVLIDVFRPRTFVEGVPFLFAYSLLPEVN
jgi:hypothetical protein